MRLLSGAYALGHPLRIQQQSLVIAAHVGEIGQGITETEHEQG